GGVNVHASLLPRWRGASPVAAAILAGDTQTGVCIMQMEEGLDTGPVYAHQAVALDHGATTPMLTRELAEVGARLLSQVLAQMAGGPISAVPQDEANATYAPRLKKQAGSVDWGVMTATEVD